MKCPNCNETLLIAERHNIEIDYCPACRGVWLDKGELDKMLDYAASKYPDTDENRRSGYNDRGDNSGYGHYKDKGGYRPHKKKSFLGDFFDFD